MLIVCSLYHFSMEMVVVLSHGACALVVAASGKCDDVTLQTLLGFLLYQLSWNTQPVR
jgi:hypothetical protein